ncbi:MAG: hypothetical protein KJ050_04875 [Candidatus Omnitrophica bacterium]|nr:MAG: hypothetical protein UZ16_OP3001001814 [Candidatus Hinthialibacteria bacterium OLB16]MBK7497155.1 hypothetical protein [Candidatus Omnitrophota bacterium]MBV6480546.1 hypothetical protein [bacterium]MBW7939128.1 hypothetical protein [Candidatus Omnitrophota bacterium]MCK6494824.1 hypothetical protein [bacterium]
MNTHVTLLGILFIISGIKRLFLVVLLMLAAAGLLVFPGILLGLPYLAFGGTALVGVIGAFLMCSNVFLGILDILCGYGLIERKKWGRILGIGLGAVSLASFPLGTILGIYALWVLLQEETDILFWKSI